MTWFYLTLLCALSLATLDMLAKKALKTTNSSTVSLIRFVACLPPLYILLYINGAPVVQKGFWLVVLIATPLEISAMLLYNQAIKLSPLSLTLPFLAFTPIFLIGTSYVIIGETTNIYGLLGILMIAFGGYILNIDPQKGLIYPLKAAFHEKGSTLMIIVTIIYSFTSVLGKLMINKSDFIFAPAAYFTIVSIISLFLAAVNKNHNQKINFDNKKLHLMIGFFSGLMIILHFTAISMTKVEYMISVKRSSMLFSILYGWLVFKEIDIKKRLAGTVIMLIGVAIIGIYG